MAREGKELERPACHVEIYEITVEELCLPYVTMTVSCSKGTYIRTLCHDISARLGCGGCMTKLLRTRVSLFVEQARKLSEIEKLGMKGTWNVFCFLWKRFFEICHPLPYQKRENGFYTMEIP